MSAPDQPRHQIRLLEERDVSAVLQIGRLIWKDDPIVQTNLPLEISDAFSNAWRKPVFWVAEEHRSHLNLHPHVVGFAGMGQSGINYHVFEFTWCNVLREFQGRGIGRLLVETRIRAAKEAGAKVISLTTMVPEVYKRYGFKIVSAHRLWGSKLTSIMVLEI